MASLLPPFPLGRAACPPRAGGRPRAGVGRVRCSTHSGDEGIVNAGDSGKWESASAKPSNVERTGSNGNVNPLFSYASRRNAVVFLASVASFAGIAKLLRSAPLWAAFGGSKDFLAEFDSAENGRVKNRVGEIAHSDEEWRRMLSPAEYGVLRKEGTEYPFSSPLYKEIRVGTFRCKGCGSPLFNSTAKYDSGTGWPSFVASIPGAVDETLDYSLFGSPRTEIRCHRCQSHLGHVFNDGPQPTGKRYCMNGIAMEFELSES